MSFLRRNHTLYTQNCYHELTTREDVSSLFDDCRDINNTNSLLKQVFFCYYHMEKELDKVFSNGFNIKLIIEAVMRYYVDFPDCGDVNEFGQVLVKLKQYAKRFKAAYLGDLKTIDSFSVHSVSWVLFEERYTAMLSVMNEVEVQYDALLNQSGDCRLFVFIRQINDLTQKLSDAVKSLFHCACTLLSKNSVPLSDFFAAWKKRVSGQEGFGPLGAFHGEKRRFQCLMDWSSQIDGVKLFWEKEIGMALQHTIKHWSEKKYARLVNQSVIHSSVSGFIDKALQRASRYRKQTDNGVLSSGRFFLAVSSLNCEKKAYRIESACDTLIRVILRRYDRSLPIEEITLSQFLSSKDDRDVGNSLRTVVEELNSARIWGKSDVGKRILQECDSINSAALVSLCLS